ncbi:transferrin-binding protein-like solute binding protein, partial [Neisseria sicca]
KAAEEAAKAKAEAERKAAEEAAKAKAKAEAERKAAEEAAKAKAEAERKAAEEAAKAKAEAERKAAEEAAKAKAEAERKAAEEAEKAAKAKAEAERKAAEEAVKAKAEAERKAAEEAAKAKAEAERKAAEEAAKAKAEAERKAAEEAAKAEAERKAAEEAAKAKAEAERKAAEEAAKAEAEHKAAEEVTPKAEVAPAMQSIGGFYTMLSIDGADNKVINRVGNPDVLEVNGQKINLLPQTFDAANGMLSLSDNKIIRAIGTHLQYGHYGFYGSKKENGELNSSLVFYQGLMTPVEAMPQTGSAIYQGNAFYNDVSNINTVGSSLFNVDFGEKSLTGGVYSAEGRFNPVMLQANIAGNRFVYVDATTKNSMSGIFLGPQAEEMAGRFDHPSEGKSGTFGAAMLKD